MEKILILIGASLFGFFGTTHLLLLLFTDKFNPIADTVMDGMKSTQLIIAKESNMWKAWVGFNVGHCLGAILLAVVYIPLATNYFSFIESSVWFSVLPLLFSIVYVILGIKYWYRAPLIGSVLAAICFLIAAVSINT